tara:strand:+ start:1399 stop:1581 length:183 start_codon:yes stop_codon:yes gene_type:complete
MISKKKIISSKMTIEVLNKLREKMGCKEEYFICASTQNGYEWDVIDSSYGKVKVWTERQK